MTLKNKSKAFAFLLAGSIAFSTASFGKEIKITAEIKSHVPKEGAFLIIHWVQSGKTHEFPAIKVPVESTTTQDLGTITVDDAQPLYFMGATEIGGYASNYSAYVNKDQQKYIDPEKINHITLKTTVIPSRNFNASTYTYVLE